VLRNMTDELNDLEKALGGGDWREKGSAKYRASIPR